MSPPSPNVDADKGATVGLTIRLFGSFDVQVENRPIPALRTRKGAWLLALLVLRQERPVDRVWLAATLWPDSDHAESLRNLRDSLYDLRKALGSAGKRLLAPTPGTLALDLTGAYVDLIRFDSLVAEDDPSALNRAAAIYQGSLLEGCQEEWVLVERERRQQVFLNAQEALAESEIEKGRIAEAMQRLWTCVRLDPFRETAHRALMSAMAAARDFAGAMQVYREFRLRLHEELQSPPAVETTALYEQIRVRARQMASRTMHASATPAYSGGSIRLTEIVEPNPLHNLPLPVTSFIGREREIEQVRSLLQTASLLTLTGAGGSGKTRLALQIAGEVRESFPDGTWLVELASLSDPLLVPQAVAAALCLHAQPGTPLLDTLVERLASERLLLVLDNCEHLLVACARLAAALLRACPGVCLLATSRERLGIAGEQTYRVPSLTLPDLRPPLTVANLGRVEAVRLFVDRARLSRPDFVLNAHNVPTVASLCHRLDGIPLALELAAARVRSLSVEDIVARLEGQFDLLTGGDRSALPRHQTLRALIDWSYDLLNGQEKLLLQRLSVFPGGWTLEAAEQVATGQPLEKWEVLDLLTSLVDKSLAVAEDREDSVRYRMFDTLRHYASEKLQAGGEAEEVYRRRRAWLLALAREATEAFQIGMNAERWLLRLETEHDNLRAALAWSGTDVEGAQIGLSLATVLWRFWMVRGYGSEGREHLRQALEREGAQEGTLVRSRALSAAGNLADNQGDYRAAWKHYQESLTIRKALAEISGGTVDHYTVGDLLRDLGHMALRLGDVSLAQEMYEESQVTYTQLSHRLRASGDREELSDVLHAAGLVAQDLKDYPAAHRFYEECLALRREAGDTRMISAVLGDMIRLAQSEGDYAAACALSIECLTIKRELEDRRGVALVYLELGKAAYRHGAHQAALDDYRTGIPMFHDLGDKQHIALCLEGMAVVLLAQGEAEQAVRHWSFAAVLRAAIGAPGWRNEQIEVERQRDQARLALGERGFIDAWNEGQLLTWEQVAFPERA